MVALSSLLHDISCFPKIFYEDCLFNRISNNKATSDTVIGNLKFISIWNLNMCRENTSKILKTVLKLREGSSRSIRPWEMTLTGHSLLKLVSVSN